MRSSSMPGALLAGEASARPGCRRSDSPASWRTGCWCATCCERAIASDRMRMLLLGVSHHTAPIDLRERLAFRADRVPSALGLIEQQHGIGESVLLSACN